MAQPTIQSIGVGLDNAKTEALRIQDAIGKLPKGNGATGRMDYSSGTGVRIPIDPLTGLDIPQNNPNNPVGNSDGVRAGYDSLGNEITSFADTTGLTKAGAANTKLIEDRMKALDAQRKEEIAQIRQDYEAAAAGQEKRQEKSYAGRATGLVTSGGGFLGTTQSQQGVLQSLSDTFEGEKTALAGKRDEAIRAAQNAFDGKDFALAQSLIKEAKDTEQELYNRQKDFNTEKLALSRESRAQQEFEFGITDKKVEGYSRMDDATFAALTPEALAAVDKFYYPGYTEQVRDISQKSETVKTDADAINLDSNILNMRLKMPNGQKFTINGKEYTGLNKERINGLTQGEKTQAVYAKITQLFSPGFIIPNSDNIPFVDNDGYSTPEGWKAAIRISGLPRKDFIEQYGYLVPTGEIQGYGLTRPEQDIIKGKL